MKKILLLASAGLVSQSAQAQHGVSSSASCGSLIPSSPTVCQRDVGAARDSAKAFADFGVLRAYAQAEQLAALPGGASSFAMATARFYDTVTISSPNLAGQSGSVTFRMPVDYSFTTYLDGGLVSTATLAGRVAIGASSRPQELNNSRLNVEVRHTSAGQVLTRSETEKPGTDRNNGIIELNYSFVFGVPFQLNASLDATATAAGVKAGATMNAYQSAIWGGVASLSNAAGQAVPYSMSSSSGFDYRLPYAAPVPEPSTWLLLAAGLGVLQVCRRRYGVAPRSAFSMKTL